MPQLDSTTFFSQFFWVAIFFLGFYLYWLRNILPTLSALLKMRQKRIDWCTKKISDFEKEGNQIQDAYENLWFTSLKKSREVYLNTFQTSSKWLQTTINEVNKTTFLPIHETYIQTMSEMYAEENLITNQLPKKEQLPSVFFQYVINSRLSTRNEV